MKILVSGASGLLGSNLVMMLKDHYEIFALYHQHTIENSLITSFDIDLTDSHIIQSLIRKIVPDLILHCAALTDVDYCECHDSETHRCNVETTKNVAYAARSVNATMIYISTDSVFDGLKGTYHETDTPSPVNVYAQTKLVGEQTVQSILPSALIVRTNIYGWNFQKKESLAEWMLRQLEEKQSVHAFHDIYFTPILVNDLIDILLDMIKRNLSGIYHVASNESCSKYEFGQTLAKVFGFNPDLVCPISHKEVALKASRPRNTSLCTCKVSQELSKRMPDVVSGLHRFKSLRDEGYVKQLKSLQKLKGY